MWNIQFFIRVMKELAWNASDIQGIDVWFRIKKHKCLFIYYLCFNDSYATGTIRERHRNPSFTWKVYVQDLTLFTENYTKVKFEGSILILWCQISEGVAAVVLFY